MGRMSSDLDMVSQRWWQVSSGGCDGQLANHAARLRAYRVLFIFFNITFPINLQGRGFLLSSKTHRPETQKQNGLFRTLEKALSENCRVWRVAELLTVAHGNTRLPRKGLWAAAAC